MKLVKSIFLVLLVSFVAYGQDMSDFTSLKSGGIVPEDFRTLSSEKYEADYNANRDENLDKNFFLSTRFFIDELLLSGKVLFNEPLSDYIERVAKYTLRRKKDVFKELRFYVLKSTSANAFSTDQGIIIFTTGLLAQLENEAQLAYIIAHEVSHYTEKHVRDTYVENQSFNRGRGKYQRLSYESRIDELSTYKKDNEFEADQKGIDIYLDSEYAIDEIFSSFDILLYSYLPFDDVKFDTSYFNTEELIVPGIFFPDSINEITAEDDYDDSRSTHPNLRKRIDAAFEYVENKSTRGDEKFKISEETFFEIRNKARFETINLLISERQYGKAIYDIFLLQRDFPDNRFLDLSLVKSLYGLAKYKNANRYSEVTERFKYIEGESYAVHYFLKQLSREQLNVIALRHAHDAAKKYHSDKAFTRYLDDLKKEIATKKVLDFENLRPVPYETYIAEVAEEVSTFNVEDSIARVDESDLSKYEKIKLKKKLRVLLEGSGEGGDNASDFYLFGLHDLVSTGGLIDELKDIRRQSENADDDPGSEINSVVVVDPVFEDYNLKNKRNHTKSEDKKINLANSYARQEDRLGMDVNLVDSKNINKEDVNKYNEIGVIFQWFQEVLEHDDMDFICSSHDRMEPIRELYGTDHFLFSGIYTYKERNKPSLAHFYGVIFVYTIPLVIADLLIVHHSFEMVAFSINADSDSVEFLEVNDVNLRGTNKVVDAYIYDVLYQLNQSQLSDSK